MLSVPENVWKIDELVMEDTKEVDFMKSDRNNWWNYEPLKSLDLSSNVIKTISPNVKLLQELVTLKVILIRNNVIRRHLLCSRSAV